ncbi:glycosyltransferase family 39 protein [Microbacterium sp. STN6]|uniref:glycosyltransferase family 39 protein n=1 Tax=Microbacterium sp. STN6 TaxID=2995588 RepID=UPI002260A5A8|nr:glycosyltransferase family 39 protein [Microbacterium sp. STN6]MCX7521956.1 glycosyltransferase family 39 protein [Microbacterium sp. STN6]
MSWPHTLTAAGEPLAAGSRRMPSGLAAWLPSIASGAVMAALGAWGLGRTSMYGTEGATYWAAHLPLAQLWHLLGHVDAVHGLYYLMMHGVFALGSSTVVLRLPSLIGAIAAVALTARVAQLLTGRWVIALTSGLVLAALPLVNEYAQVGRSYALDLALVMAASLALLHALRGNHSAVPRWLLYLGLVVLAGYLHEMTTLMLLAHGATLLWARVPRATLRAWMLCACGAAVAMTPLIVVSHAEEAQLAWIGSVGWAAAGRLYATLFGSTPGVVATVSALVGGALLFGVGGARSKQSVGMRAPSAGMLAPSGPQRAPVSLVQFALPLLVLPGAALIIESSLSTPLYGGVRYVLYSSAGVALLAGYGAYEISRRLQPALRGSHLERFVCAAVVAIILVAGAPLQVTLRTASGHPQDMLSASEYVTKHARAGDAILFLPEVSSLARLAYPGDFSHVNDIALAASPMSTGTFYGTQHSLPAIVDEVLETRRVWEFSNDGSTGMSARQRRERATLERDFHLARKQEFTGITVRLWVRDAGVGRPAEADDNVHQSAARGILGTF